MALHLLPNSLASIDSFAPALFDMALRSLVILALTGLAASFLRHASAATRHWIWLLGLTGLLLLPAFSMALPAWHVLPRFKQTTPIAQTTQTILIPPAEPAFPPPTAANSVPPAKAPVPAAAPISQSTPMVPAKSPAPALATPNAPPIAAAAAHSTAPAQSVLPYAIESRATSKETNTFTFPWVSVLLLAWLAGTLLVLVHILLGNFSLYLLQRRSTRLEQGDLAALLSELRGAFHIRRPVDLLTTPLRTMPMTWGFWRTRLLLPDQSAKWSADQRKSVLLHELAHVKRHDCLTQLLAQLACAFYWFNPLVWLTWHRLQIERERACDDLVLSAGTRASTYAGHLLHSASDLHSPHLLTGAVAMARPSTLEERLRAILDSRRNRRALTLPTTLTTLTLLLAALIPVAALRAQQTPANPPVEAAQEVPPARSSATAPPMPSISPEDVAARQRGAVTAQPPAGGRSGRANVPFSAPTGTPFGGGGGGGFSSQQNTSAEGPTAALDATIYDVRLPAEQIGRLDVEALTKAADTAANFEKALAAIGTAKPLYRANQSVRLANDYINIGTQTPYVTNSQITANGQTINTVAYRNTGAMFNIVGSAESASQLNMDLKIEVSTLFEGNTAITATVKAPMFRTSVMSHRGPVTPTKPFVIVNADAANLDADGKAMAFIARITLGSAQRPFAPAGNNNTPR